MKTSFLLLFLSMFIVDACEKSRENQPEGEEDKLMVPMDSVEVKTRADTTF